jgi:hypothetical protein
LGVFSFLDFAYVEIFMFVRLDLFANINRSLGHMSGGCVPLKKRASGRTVELIGQSLMMSADRFQTKPLWWLARWTTYAGWSIGCLSRSVTRMICQRPITDIR